MSRSEIVIFCTLYHEPASLTNKFKYIFSILIRVFVTAPKCNGDPNAMVFECPTSCPSTCDRPDTSSQPCIAMCDPSGCMCKAGYILSKIGGKCILPHECPGLLYHIFKSE